MTTQRGPDWETILPQVSSAATEFPVPNAGLLPLVTSPELAHAALCTLLDHSPATISLYDVNGIHRFVNRPMSGIQPSVAVGRHISEIVPPEYKSEIVSRFNRAIQSQQSESFTLPGRDGTPLAYQACIAPVVLDEQVVAMLSIVTGGSELVERRNVELQAQWYARLAEQINLRLYVVKVERTATGHTLRNISINPAAERLIGVGAQDWVGRTIDECFPALRARGLVEMAVRVVETGDSVEVTHFQHGQENLSGDWSYSMFPLLDQHVGVMLSDISQRKPDERQSRRMFDELARVSRISTMREMASGIAHELNQPLAAIVAYADACLELIESGRMNGRQLADVLRSVSNQAERAGRIIHRLRQMIKRDQPSHTQLSVNDVIRETADLFDSVARQAGVTVRMNLEQDLPEVYADFIQVQQVVFNLMYNAVEAMSDVPQNHRRLTISTGQFSDQEIEIAVHDLGHGLTNESAGRFFEPFFSTRPNGIGLGLSVSRTIVEALGGLIELTPNPDAGVTARIILPVSKGKAPHAEPAHSLHR